MNCVIMLRGGGGWRQREKSAHTARSGHLLQRESEVCRALRLSALLRLLQAGAGAAAAAAGAAAVTLLLLRDRLQGTGTNRISVVI